MDDAMLRADCARCAALCCVSLVFDRSDMFAFDKAAGVACWHLTADHECGIHPALESRGFGGCIAFDCLGAGQRVTQELFGGRSWREHPAIAQSMFDAFRGMRLVHELLLLLRTASRLPLRPRQASQRRKLESALQPPEGWSPKTLTAFEQSQGPAEIRAFLGGLKHQATPAAVGRQRLAANS
jgi:hypothetical protein